MLGDVQKGFGSSTGGGGSKLNDMSVWIWCVHFRPFSLQQSQNNEHFIHRSSFQTFTLACYPNRARPNVYDMSMRIQTADVNLSSSFKVLCNVNEDSAIQSDARVGPRVKKNEKSLNHINRCPIFHYAVSYAVMPVKSYSGNHAKFPLGCGLWLALIRVTPSTIPGRLWNDLTLGLCRSKSKWRGSLKGKVWSCSVASLTSIFLIWRSIFPFLPYFSNPYLQFFHHCHWSLESIGVVDLLGWSNPCSSWTPGWRQPDFFFQVDQFFVLP